MRAPHIHHGELIFKLVHNTAASNIYKFQDLNTATLSSNLLYPLVESNQKIRESFKFSMKITFRNREILLTNIADIYVVEINQINLLNFKILTKYLNFLKHKFTRGLS
jgi:hypothetical protein